MAVCTHLHRAWLFSCSGFAAYLLPSHCPSSLHSVLSQYVLRSLVFPPAGNLSSRICFFNWSSALFGPQLQLQSLPLLPHLTLCSRFNFQLLITSYGCCIVPALVCRISPSLLLVWQNTGSTTRLLHFQLPIFLFVQPVKNFLLGWFAQHCFDSHIFLLAFLLSSRPDFAAVFCCSPCFCPGRLVCRLCCCDFGSLPKAQHLCFISFFPCPFMKIAIGLFVYWAQLFNSVIQLTMLRLKRCVSIKTN